MKYFKPSEFVCRCCGKGKLQESTLEKLDKAREVAGTPFYINSGFRCEAHNRSVGGVKESSHTRGYAVDIRINVDTSAQIIEALKESGFNRIGVASNFVHVDDDPDKPTNVTWKYK